MGLIMDETQRFQTMIDQLINPQVSVYKKISKKSFEKFCYEYIFDAVKGFRFGEAFCKKFQIIDWSLMMQTQSYEDSKKYIIENYLK